MRTMRFLFSLWKANLQAAMEYRASFLTQVIGMMLNNGVYFIFWILFFDRFKEIRGWGVQEMFLLFGLVAAGIGLSSFLFGNVLYLTEVIINGQLDYYLSFPRPVLLHTLASRSVSNGLGDFLYGIISFLLARQISPDSILRFSMSVVISGVVFVSFMVLVQSLAFWMGNTQMVSGHAINAIITFSLYPINLFDGSARLLLFTLIPAAFVGALPAEMVLRFSWQNFGMLLAGAVVFLALALVVFQRGLRRYESGSAIQIQS